MNGQVEAWQDGRLSIEVRQSFGNCPRYIVPREPRLLARMSAGEGAQTLGPELDAAARALIARSDTLFIASASARPAAPDRSEGVDVSHRGGKPGFLRLEDEARGLLLTLPDYAGNQFFMTLGNLSVNAAAGLLLVDYAGGGLLHLSADAEIVWDGASLAAWPGAQRLVRLRVRAACGVRARCPGAGCRTEAPLLGGPARSAVCLMLAAGQGGGLAAWWQRRSGLEFRRA